MSYTEFEVTYLTTSEYLKLNDIYLDYIGKSNFSRKLKSYCNDNSIVVNKKFGDRGALMFPSFVFGIVYSISESNNDAWLIESDKRLTEYKKESTLKHYIKSKNITLSKKEYEVTLRELMSLFKYKHKFIYGEPYLIFKRVDLDSYFKVKI